MIFHAIILMILAATSLGCDRDVEDEPDISITGPRELDGALVSLDGEPVGALAPLPIHETRFAGC